MEDKFDFIDDFLMHCEDWMHGKDGRDVTTCRKYLAEFQEKVKNCSISDINSSYSIDFDGNCKAKIKIMNGEPKVEAAMNGWGEIIKLSDIKIEK